MRTVSGLARADVACGRAGPGRVTWALVVVGIALLLPELAPALEPTQWAVLTAPDPLDGDLFGQNVAIDRSGDVIVVGAIQGTIATGLGPGRAFVYERTGAVWNHTATLTPSSPQPDNWYGSTVAVDGDVIVVGAGGAVLPNPPINYPGAAYVYERQGGAWVETQKLVPSESIAGDYFGYAVGVYGDTIVAGAFWNSKAFVFQRGTGGTWTETQVLKPVRNDQWHFGEVFDFDDNGTTLAVGAHLANATEPLAGAVYLFDRVPGGPWVESAILTADDGQVEDRFGQFVAIEGDVLLTGARKDDDVALNAGSAYVFERINGTWTQVQKLLPPADAHEQDVYAIHGDLTDGVMAIGMPGYDAGGQDAGAVFMYEKIGGTWLETRRVENVANTFDTVGFAIALRHGTVVAGAPGTSDIAFRAGSTHLYAIDDPDRDGIPTYVDNCPYVANFDQEDLDGNGFGDVCEGQCQATLAVSSAATVPAVALVFGALLGVPPARRALRRRLRA